VDLIMEPLVWASTSCFMKQAQIR